MPFGVCEDGGDVVVEAVVVAVAGGGGRGSQDLQGTGGDLVGGRAGCTHQ